MRVLDWNSFYKPSCCCKSPPGFKRAWKRYNLFNLRRERRGPCSVAPPKWPDFRLHTLETIQGRVWGALSRRNHLCQSREPISRGLLSHLSHTRGQLTKNLHRSPYITNFHDLTPCYLDIGLSLSKSLGTTKFCKFSISQNSKTHANTIVH